MKFKRSIFAVLVFSVLFTSCFNNLKAPKETSVSFYMDEATVQKILQTSTKARSAASSRAAADEQNDTAGYFIDVTLIGEVEQTQTASLSTDVQMSFTNILVNSRVYAKAQIYKYLNSEQSEKEIIYRGESKKITVRDNGNVLSIKLTTATLTVTFDSNGGSEVPSQLVLTGSAATEPEKPVKPEGKKKYSRENYAFAGWFTDPELTKEYNFELPVKDDLTLYAKWLPDFVFVEGATVNDYLVTGRNIKISDLFVSDHEVTQAEYKAVIGSNPSNNKTADNLPVENVTWLEAIEYCNKLSESQGLDPCYKINGSEVTCTLSANGYRLPTEAEWEYIAGKAKRENTSFANLAWTTDNSGNNTHQVKYNLADELCLCDIYGNVAEWCFDVYSETVTKSTGATGPMAVAGTSANRVVRGGSFQSSAAECTPQTRASADPAEKSAAIGFRVVRTVVYEFKIARNTVTFEPNGGSSVEVQIVIQGDCATEPAAPTRTGYIFKGWQYADEDFDFSTSITQDIMLEAKWEAIKYKVKFNGGASTTGTMPDQVFTYDVEAELSENQFNPPSNAWKFGGWSKTLHTNLPAEISFDYSDKQNVKNLSSQNNDEITLYALWIDRDACSIQYLDVPEGVTNSNAVTFRISQNVTLTDLTRDYYTFDGWYIVNDDSTETLTTGWSSGTYESNLKLRAKWTPIEYNWTFERNGGTWNSYTPASTYNVTQTITLPGSSQITKEGYDFAGWYIGTDETNIITGWAAGDKHEESGITLNAKWTPGDNKYKVQHWQQKTNGGENPVTNYTCFEEETITLKGNGNRVKTGDTTAATAKTYNGFTSKSFEQTTVAADGSTVINIYYNRNEITYTYTLGSGETWGTSESPNGDNNVVKEGLYGATVVLPQVKKTDYDFKNWKSGAITLSSTSTYGLENKTFAATWDLHGYKIKYHLNGGSYANFTGGTYDDQDDTYTINFTVETSPVTLVSNPTRSNYNFGGWYTDNTNFTNSITSITTATAGSQDDCWNVYAKWNYTVIYTTNGGTSIPNQTYAHNQGIVKPADPELTGYDFDYWYTTDQNTPFNSFNDSSAITGHTYLNAHWTAKTYTIEYYYGSNAFTFWGSGYEAPLTYTYGTQTYLPSSSNVSRNGYTFAGWYSTPELEDGDTWTRISSSETGTKKFYAKWTPKSYTISYMMSASSTFNSTYWKSGYEKPTSFTVENTITLPTASNIARPGYAFQGWYSTSALSGDPITTINPGDYTENKVFYSKFELETYTIEWFNTEDSTVKSGSYKNSYQYTDSAYTLPTLVHDDFRYKFDGWYTEDTFENKYNSLSSGSYGNKRFYAKWTSLVKEVSSLAEAQETISAIGYNDSESIIKFTSAATLSSDDITTLGTYVNSCSYPIGIDLSEVTGITEIPDEAFKQNAKLLRIILPSGVETIGANAFSQCAELISAELPDGIKTIGNSAFYYVTKLADVNLPDSITEIGNNAFGTCYKLKVTHIPTSLQKIGSSAFNMCNGTTADITLPASLTEMGSRPFSAKFTNIYVDSNNPNYSDIDGVLCNKAGDTMLQFPQGRTGEYTIPSSITTLEISAMAGCNLTKVTIPSTVTELKQNAINYTTSITTLVFEQRTTALKFGYRVFGQVSNLTTVTYGGTSEEWNTYCKVSGYAATDDTWFDCDKFTSGVYCEEDATTVSYTPTT